MINVDEAIELLQGWGVGSYYADHTKDIIDLLQRMKAVIEEDGEWIYDPFSAEFCPHCKRWKLQGHVPDCERAKFFEAIK